MSQIPLKEATTCTNSLRIFVDPSTLDARKSWEMLPGPPACLERASAELPSANHTFARVTEQIPISDAR